LADEPDLRPVLELLNATTKAEAEKLADALVLEERALSYLILGAQAGALGDYSHSAYFDHETPRHLRPAETELAALGRTGVGRIIDRQALKAIRKIEQTFVERRMLAAHIFYTPCQRFWHLFHFRQQDLKDRDSHWIGGRHIHYTSDLFVNQPASAVWNTILDEQSVKIRGVHIRSVPTSRPTP
jgi:hypothetical protein